MRNEVISDALHVPELFANEENRVIPRSTPQSAEAAEGISGGWLTDEPLRLPHSHTIHPFRRITSKTTRSSGSPDDTLRNFPFRCWQSAESCA